MAYAVAKATIPFLTVYTGIPQSVNSVSATVIPDVVERLNWRDYEIEGNSLCVRNNTVARGHLDMGLHTRTLLCGYVRKYGLGSHLFYQTMPQCRGTGKEILHTWECLPCSRRFRCAWQKGPGCRAESVSEAGRRQQADHRGG